MEHEALSDILAMGETASVEFKRCGQQPERDTFETVCSFANTFGGPIYLGVEDDGSVVGVKADGLLPVKRNIINVVNNPRLFDSPVAVEFEELDFDGRALLRIWVPPSPNMHRFKGEIYERGSLSVAEAVDAGYSRRTAQRAIAKLVGEGVIEPVGNTRSRRYVPAE